MGVEDRGGAIGKDIKSNTSRHGCGARKGTVGNRG